MNRVKDHICFVVWFVGLSYIALWPMAVPAGIAAWLGAADVSAPTPLACAGFAVAPLLQLCRADPAMALSPGLHLAGILAALYVMTRLGWLLLSRLLWRLLPRVTRAALSPARLRVALRRPFLHTSGRRAPTPPPPPPRFVPRRGHFGLRRVRR